MKKINFFILLFLFTGTIYSQSANQNFNKYWFYRDRLEKRFVMIGDQPGQSLVASQINGNISNGVVTGYSYGYSDQTIKEGWYLGVLATEHKLLAQNYQPTLQTEKELYYAMKAFERLDYEAETQPGYTDLSNGILTTSACNTTYDFHSNVPNAINGFFMRDDISMAGFDANLKPYFMNQKYCSFQYNNAPISTPQSGLELFNNQPTTDPVNELECVGLLNEMSQDQAFSMLMGFALIFKYVDVNASYNGYNFHTEAMNNAYNIIHWIRNSHAEALPGPTTFPSQYFAHRPVEFPFGMAPSTLPWTIVSPTTGIRVYRGAFAQMFSNPLAETNKFFTGSACQDIGSQASNPFWQNLQILHTITNIPIAIPLSCVTALSAADYTALQLIYSAGLSYSSSSNESFIVTMAALSDDFHTYFIANTTQAELDFRTHVHGMECYALLHACLHNVPNHFQNNLWTNQPDFQGMLDAAPTCGPFNDGGTSVNYHSIYGGSTAQVADWDVHNRFHYFTSERQNHHEPAEFNGLDYMLLYNLYNIYFPNYSATTGSTAAVPNAYYYNKMDYECSTNFPFTFGGAGMSSSFTVGDNANPANLEAFNSITYTGTVAAGGNVTYHAGNEVHLASGTYFASNSSVHVTVNPYCPNANGYARGNGDSTVNNGYDGMIGNDNAQFASSKKDSTPHTYAVINMHNDTPNEDGNTYGEMKPSVANIITNSSVVISPNPSHGSFTIELISPKTELAEATIYNTLGVKVQTIATFNQLAQGINRQQINTEQLAPGFYNIQLKTLTQVINKQFIIQ